MRHLAAALVLVSSPVFADMPPPAEFDHPFPGVLLEIIVPEAEVPAACRQIAAAYGGEPLPATNGRGNVLGGCSARAPTGPAACTIVIRQGPDMEAIRRHETAHCNGWVHD